MLRLSDYIRPPSGLFAPRLHFANPFGRWGFCGRPCCEEESGSGSSGSEWWSGSGTGSSGSSGSGTEGGSGSGSGSGSWTGYSCAKCFGANNTPQEALVSLPALQDGAWPCGCAACAGDYIVKACGSCAWRLVDGLNIPSGTCCDGMDLQKSLLLLQVDDYSCRGYLYAWWYFKDSDGVSWSGWCAEWRSYSDVSAGANAFYAVNYPDCPGQWDYCEPHIPTSAGKYPPDGACQCSTGAFLDDAGVTFL